MMMSKLRIDNHDNANKVTVLPTHTMIIIRNFLFAQHYGKRYQDCPDQMIALAKYPLARLVYRPFCHRLFTNIQALHTCPRDPPDEASKVCEN